MEIFQYLNFCKMSLHLFRILGDIENPIIDRSSRPELFCKKCVLKNFTKFTGKHLRQSLFFKKVAGIRLQLSLKKDSGTGFSCEFCEIFKNIFFYRTPPVAASELKLAKVCLKSTLTGAATQRYSID